MKKTKLKSDQKELAPDEIESKKDTIGYWLKWIPLARKAAKDHILDTQAAWNEYNKEYADNSLKIPRTHDNMMVDIGYPLYWSACQLLEPSYYSHTPEITTNKLFGTNDVLINTSEVIISRLGDYFIRCSNFDDVMQECVGDFIHGAKTTTQVVYEAALVEKKVRIDLTQIDSGYTDANGQKIPDYITGTGEHFPKKEEVFKDDKGYFGYGTDLDVDDDSQNIVLKSVIYDEVLHTPNAKNQAEIMEMAYYFCFTKEEAKEFFDASVIANFPWKKGRIYNKNQQDDRNVASFDEKQYETPDEYMDGFEIWDKESKMLRWVSESYPSDFLKPPANDPYKLEHFFPSPAFAMQSKPRKSMYPTPPFIHLRPTVLQLHLMWQRTFGLIDSIRRRAIVDGDEDLINALRNLGDMEFISAKSIKSIVEKGGLDKMIWYLPVQELVTAINEMGQLEDRFVASFDRWFGTPSILQGDSDPQEGVGTNEIKANSANDRFKNSKKKIQKLARDSLEMMIDLALYVFSDEKIMQITGFQYMSPQDQQQFTQALSILRNDKSRTVRIDIETDSFSFQDREARNQRRQAAIQTVMQGIQGIPAMMQLDPIAANIAMQALLLGLDGIDAGKQFEDDVRNLVQSLMQKAQTPPPPPQPDPMLQIEQGRLQLEQQKHQDNMNFKMQELQQKGSIATDDAQIKAQAVQVQAAKTETAAQQAQTKASLDAASADFQKQIDAQTLLLEKVKLIADTRAKDIEQQRLDKEQILEQMRLMHDHIIALREIAAGTHAKHIEHSQAMTGHAVNLHAAQSAPKIPEVKIPTSKLPNPATPKRS